MGHKLLLADDSVTIQRVIELTFADEDIQVTAVGDGRQAIEYLQQHRPDIVLADVGMPEQDGYEVAAFVKAHQDLSHVPVLLLTGAFEPIDEARARAAGCDGVLVKPFEPQMVIGRVKELLAGRQPGGLWSAPSAVGATATHALHAPIGEAGARGAIPADPPPAPAGSLEDYFDRLDAAFATHEGGVQSASAPPMKPAQYAALEPQLPARDLASDLAGWDPELSADGPRPVAPRPGPVEQQAAASAVPAPRAEQVAPTDDRPAASAPAPETTAERLGMWSGPAPQLAEAFAALLSSEQGQRFAPSTVGPQAALSEEAIEAIVRRVVMNMAEHTVRETVLDVAERLVREEIARIKAAQH